MKTILNRPWKEALLILLLLSPLLFFNVRDSHDWGDDFAAYLQQASNMVHGKSQDATGFIRNVDMPNSPPQVYMPGFPMLLAPVLYFFGDGIAALTRYLSFFMVGMGMLMYFLFRRQFSILVSCCGTLLFFYNPAMVEFKTQVLSDLPFGFFFLWTLLLYRGSPRTWKNYLLMGVLSGLMISIRSIGAVFPLAVLLYEVFRMRPWHQPARLLKTQGRTWLHLGLLLGAAGAVYGLLIKVLFPVHDNGFSGYGSMYSLHDLPANLVIGAKYYSDEFLGFFLFNNDKWNLISKTISIGINTFFLVGFGWKLYRRPELQEWILLLYFLVLFSYGDHSSSFRYLLPVFPLILYYACYGLSRVWLFVPLPAYLPALLFSGLVLTQSLPELQNISAARHETVFGPQHPDGKELIQFIRTHTGKDDIICFGRARALSYYAGRYSFYPAYQGDPDFFEENFRHMHVSYIIQFPHNWNWDLHNGLLDDYIRKYRSSLDSVWSNANFIVYRFHAESAPAPGRN